MKLVCLFVLAFSATVIASPFSSFFSSNTVTEATSGNALTNILDGVRNILSGLLSRVRAIFAKVPTQQCPANEVYTKCGNSCSERCDNLLILCTAGCSEGCHCKEGYLRRVENGEAKECVPQEQCTYS